jgi:hypothetical protein
VHLALAPADHLGAVHPRDRPLDPSALRHEFRRIIFPLAEAQLLPY